ncbi:hypothetical protein PENTCL1PPCAC_7314 [Pristionchus entomophagus]|uniref:Uncharacterized protein n=1 Tax=Pristionchus entomophagus TaxID=358040 RepID=A0AAV5SUV7_9BILA|nr:hypothetical protein PENTCL1PPCAC_7314 [Pristionchus entomophagus]
MPKRLLETDECPDIKVKKGAVEKSPVIIPILDKTEIKRLQKNSLAHNDTMQKTEEIKSEKEDGKSVELVQQQQQLQQVYSENENIKMHVVMLTGDVTRLQHELAASTTAAKDAKLLAKMLDEQCGLLKYERDGLKSKVNTFNDEKKKMENEIIYLRETTSLLVKKVEWYTKKCPSDQKMPEGLDKNKGDHELKKRVDELEKLLRDAQREKEGTAEMLKGSNIVCENLTDNQTKLVEELKYSLEVRQKMNNTIDEMEKSMKDLCNKYHEELNKAKDYVVNLQKEKDATDQSMKELRCQYYKYEEGLKSAKEYVVTLKREKEEISSELTMREDEIKEMDESMKKMKSKYDEYEKGLVCATDYIKTLNKEKQELMSDLRKREKEIMEIKATTHRPFSPPLFSQFPTSVNQSNPPIFFPSLPPSNSWKPGQNTFFNGPPHHPHRLPAHNIMPALMNSLQGSNGPPDNLFFHG